MPTVRWRVKRPCYNCPFTKTRAGIRLWRTLTIQFRREILLSLRHGKHFVCHKTSDKTGTGENLACAGALTWQHRRGLMSDMEQVMRRLGKLKNR